MDRRAAVLRCLLDDGVENTITLLALGGHEDFYRDLKRYLA